MRHLNTEITEGEGSRVRFALYSFNLKVAIWAMRKLSGFNDQK